MTQELQWTSVEETAQVLGVSMATVRNWTKAGYIVPVTWRPLVFLKDDIFQIQTRIKDGDFQRLTSRANKTHSCCSFLPIEYAQDSVSVQSILAIKNFAQRYSLNKESILYLVALRILELSGEVILRGNHDLIQGNWKRHSIQKVMEEWAQSLPGVGSYASYASLRECVHSCTGCDFLGLVYQSLAQEGKKSCQGSYYTPQALVTSCIHALKADKGGVQNFLDPCCGSGLFLCSAGNLLGLKLQDIFGFDNDPFAVKIAQINLLLQYPADDFTPNIQCLDSLRELATGELFCETNSLMGQVDAIATNPPWGADKNSSHKKQSGSVIKSGESFSLFLEKSIHLLREGGRLSMVLPESILRIKAHEDIRNFILHQTNIQRIRLLGRKFTGVFTPVLQMDLQKKQSKKNSSIRIESANKKEVSSISQSRFLRNESFVFDVEVLDMDEALIEKIYATKYQTLAQHAQWALGIVTGNNEKFLSDSRKSPQYEEIIRGRDISPYCLNRTEKYIHFVSGAYQQAAPEKMYRAPEELIYKFISNRLVFAYDHQQRLTLNSANILIPLIPGLRIKVVLAFLNSSVFQYIFQKKFATHKVLRGDLEKLPFPYLDDQTQEILERLVDDVLKTETVSEQIDLIVANSFGLDASEIETIKKHFEISFQQIKSKYTNVFI